MTRADRLRAHIEAAAGEPVIGVDDCGPWVARWIELETGRPLAFPLYTTRDQGYDLARRAGGLVELVSPMMVEAGLWQSGVPQLGDVGIVRLSDRDTAVIFCGNGLAAIRDERCGVRYMRPRTILRAWSLP